MVEWLDGWEHQPDPTHSGGTYIAPGRPKLLLHTIEGMGIPSPFRYPVQLALDWYHGRRVQVLPLSRAGYGLEHAGGAQTNDVPGCLQVEIVGFAANTGVWPHSAYVWLAQALAEPCRLLGIDPTPAPLRWGNPLDKFASDPAWLDFCGVAGHCHVRGNVHWDPGPFRAAEFCAALRDALNPQPPTHIPAPTLEDTTLILLTDGRDHPNNKRPTLVLSEDHTAIVSYWVDAWAHPSATFGAAFSFVPGKPMQAIAPTDDGRGVVALFRDGSTDAYDFAAGVTAHV